MTILGIDLGWKRIGVAIAEEEISIALPKMTIRLSQPGSEPETIEKVSALIQECQAHTIVVGLPKHMQGTEGTAAKRARKIVSILEQVSSARFILVDERLTSKQAQNLMGPSKARNKGEVDQMAATIILQTYLDSNNR